MRTILLTLLLLTGCFVSFGFLNADNNQVDENNCKFIEKSMEEVSTLKVGMKRKNLLKMFHQDSGISGVMDQRSVYEKCEFIKINVKFELTEKNKNFSADNPEDKIIEISKSYLEHPFYD